MSDLRDIATLCKEIDCLTAQVDALRTERDEAKELVKFLVDHITENLDCISITQVIPPHECEFISDPERGKCSFCETWGAAMMLVYPNQIEEEE